MTLHDRALMLARSGDYEDAHAIIWALFKLGYSNARRDLGFRDRLKLNQTCRDHAERKRALRSENRNARS